MRSNLMWLEVWFLVGPFVKFMCANSEGSSGTARMRRIRAVSPEPTLVAYVIRTKISWAGSNRIETLLSFLLKRHATTWSRYITYHSKFRFASDNCQVLKCKRLPFTQSSQRNKVATRTLADNSIILQICYLAKLLFQESFLIHAK